MTLDDDEWRRISTRLADCSYRQGEVIFSQVRLTDHWLFITDGVAASEQTTPDGAVLIGRFFEPGHICSNITSAWARQISSDDLRAITDVEGVLLPNPLFRQEYLGGGAFGRYLRIKAMAALLFDKEILCTKTTNDTDIQYRFLEYNYREVIRRSTQKDIARFIGITPQGLSRFLKNRRGAAR
ncbi:MAG: cyclic nucleotide-binding domain-containing protein [Myxococcota bacterium]